jgi:hypothetical protein
MVVVRIPRAGAIALFVVVLIAALVACRAVASLRDLAYVAPESGAPDAGSPRCVLPVQGDASLRFGDFVTTNDHFDLCVHRTDGTSPVDDVPVLASSGSVCPPGIGYEDVLAPFAVPAGTYDVTVVKAGADCSSPIATRAGVTVGHGSTVALYLLGDGGAYAPTVTALPESDAKGLALRFLHAIPGGQALDVGPAADPTLPTTLLAPLLFFSDVTFGQVGGASNASQPVDPNGYAPFAAAGRFAIGAAPAGQSAVTLLTAPSFQGTHRYTSFAAGAASPGASFPAELFVCDENATDGVYTSCGKKVRFAAVNPYIAGPFTPYLTQRQQPALDAVAALDADVLCVNSVYPGTRRQQFVAEAAKTHFPYSAYFQTDAGAPPSDPTDQNGNVPSPPTTPPCAGFEGQLESFLSCLSTSCSDGTALTNDDPSSCILNNCYSPGATLVSSAPTCWACTLAGLQGADPWTRIKSGCEQDPAGLTPFDGEVGDVVLSRFPIVESELWVLPSTSWRSEVIRAVVSVSPAVSVDFYCTALDDDYTGFFHPYAGRYGNDAGSSDAEWAAEQLLQAQQTVAWVKRMSGSAAHRAVVAGEFYSNGAWPTEAIVGVNPATYAALTTFPLAMANGYVPQCTECAANPLAPPTGTTTTAGNTWFMYSLLVDIPASAVTSSELVLNQPTISVRSPDGGVLLIPPSTSYGYQVTVRIQP